MGCQGSKEGGLRALVGAMFMPRTADRHCIWLQLALCIQEFENKVRALPCYASRSLISFFFFSFVFFAIFLVLVFVFIFFIGVHHSLFGHAPLFRVCVARYSSSNTLFFSFFFFLPFSMLLFHTMLALQPVYLTSLCILFSYAVGQGSP